MIKVLITGAGSYVGESVRKYILSTSGEGDFQIDTVETMGDKWKELDFGIYDVVYHVAGLAHVNADPKMEPLYYKVNRDLTLEIAGHARAHGVKQFIFMSSQIVFHESKSLKPEVLTNDSTPSPNGFYGDSKLQAEIGLQSLASEGFKVCILRPCMIYGAHCKGNFPRLVKLSSKVPVFPCWHNERSMLYIDNLSEFVKQAMLRNLSGIFHLQNAQYADTVEIIRFFAEKAGKKVWITRLLNPFVFIGSFFLQPLNKMFGSYCYSKQMTSYDFDYQLVSFEDSLKIVAESLEI